MNKKIIVLLVIVAVMGGLAIFKSKTPKEDNANENSEIMHNQDNTSFEDFVKNGKGAYVCNVEQKVSDFESKGIVYIQNGETMQTRKISGEFATIAEGMNVTTNFIMKDGYSYTWSSMLQATGFKVKIQEQTGGTSTQTSGTYGFDTKQIGSYDCKNWTIDESKFALPTSVKFIEQANPSMEQGV